MQVFTEAPEGLIEFSPMPADEQSRVLYLLVPTESYAFLSPTYDSDLSDSWCEVRMRSRVMIPYIERCRDARCSAAPIQHLHLASVVVRSSPLFLRWSLFPDSILSAMRDYNSYPK